MSKKKSRLKRLDSETVNKDFKKMLKKALCVKVFTSRHHGFLVTKKEALFTVCEAFPGSDFVIETFTYDSGKFEIWIS